MLSTGKHVHTKSYILMNSSITRKSDGTNIVLLTLIWVGGVILPRKFSLIVTFYLTKTENIIEKFLTQLSHYSFE